MERSRRMRCATPGARHSFTLFGAHAVQRGERGREAAPFGGGDARLSVGTLRRLGGTALAWAWVIAMLFLVNLIGLEPGGGAAYRGVQTCAFGGTGVGLALLTCLNDTQRRAVLGTRGNAAVISLALVSAIPLCAVRFEPWANLIPLVARMALWTLLGLCAACALWRSVGAIPVACHEVRVTAPAPQKTSRRWSWSCLGLCSELAVAAALLDTLASRTDIAGATVFILALVPLALLVLPANGDTAGSHGMPTPSTAPAGGPKGAAPLLLAMATIGLTCGFHTVMGSVLYAGMLLPPSSICLCIAMAALFVRACLVPLSSPHRITALQAALCLTVVTFAPLLFLEANPLNRIWGLCQYGLVVLTTCALLLAVSTVAATAAQNRERIAIEAAERETDRPAGDSLPDTKGAARKQRATHSGPQPYALSTRALTFFFAALACGWLLGTMVGWNWGVSSIQFKIAVTLCIACLLACIMSLGVLRGTVAHGELETEIMLVTKSFGLSDAAGAPATSVPRADGQAAEPASFQGRATDMSGCDPFIYRATGAAGTCGSSQAAGAAGASGPESFGPYELLANRYALSDREHELLGPLASGRTAQQIANDLTVSRNTIKSHMAHIYTKLGIHTRAELIELVDQARTQLARESSVAVFAAESVCALEPLGPEDQAWRAATNESEDSTSMGGTGSMGTGGTGGMGTGAPSSSAAGADAS